MLHSRIEVKIAVFPNDNGTQQVSELTTDKTFIGTPYTRKHRT